jgi:hypothetical protein
MEIISIRTRQSCSSSSFSLSFLTIISSYRIQLPPAMAEEHRRKLENEAKSWLQIQTHKAALEIGAGNQFALSILCLINSF